MDSTRLFERNLFRCEEVDPLDYSKYPLASNEEFAYMETQKNYDMLKLIAEENEIVSQRLKQKIDELC